MTKSALERLLRSPDANTDTASSNVSDETAESSTEQLSEQEQSDESEESDDQTDTEETDTEGTGEEEQTADQQNEQEQEGEQETASLPIDKEGDEKLPFHKHARFQELIQEKNAAKQEVEKVKPLVDQATALNAFMRDNNIPLTDLQTHLQFMQTVRKNPSEALKILKPIYEQLAMLSGELISPELQAEVAAGTLSQERAQQIARAEASQRYSSWQQQQGQYGQQQQVADLVNGSIGLWTQTKQSIDPDLKTGTPLWEQVNLRLAAMPKFNNANEAYQGCEKAYTEAKAFLGKLRPVAQQNRRLPQSQQQNGNSNLVLKNDKDVINAIRAGLKPNQVRY